ncbi:MAG TPA: A24 family peptidase [Gammaproteobacteria bacterium]
MVNSVESILQAFNENPWLFYSTVIFASLAVGSFLNVVIYRLPVMLKNEWTADCQSFLEIEPTQQTAPFNLAKPNSTCPHCGHQIRIWENIPVLSYLLLRGRCSACKAAISAQYPAIEAITAILSVMVALRFGVSAETLFGLFLTWSLISLTVIDAKTQLLPDTITLPLLWLGLLINSAEIFTSLNAAVWGAALGYLVLWTVYQLFKAITGKEGMGYGDFKLLGALGAWMGWEMLPQIILLSSVVGAVIGISMMLLIKHQKNQPIPFGPYLAIAGWIAFMWGADINQLWLTI